MTILAEIGDKLITPWQLLMFSIPLAAIGASVGAVSRWLLIPVLGLAAFPNCWMWEEYLQGSFGQAVIAEMGYCWIAASFCAWNAPFLFGSVLVLWGHRQSVRGSRRIRGQCLNCGYDLRGNTSGICPECGTAVPVPDSAKGGEAVQ